jgi:lipopolysaccharide transport system ATP-binding protein
MQDVGESGRTVLFVSHNMPAITRLCNRAIHLEHGKVIQDGEPAAVIKKYLSSESETLAHKEWKDPTQAPTGTHSRLLSVRVKNEEGKTIDAIDIRKPFGIELVWEVFKTGLPLKPHILIRNEDGLVLFVTVDIDPEWMSKKRPIGLYKSTAWVPGNFMAEGIFYAFVYAFGGDRSRQFAVQPAVSFTVVDTLEEDSARGNTGGVFHGVVRPKLTWETDYSHGT